MKRLILIFCLLAPALPGTAMSQLPAAVSGQPLPSLAPVVEKTVPAVVNIATRGSVNVQNHPLLNDPLFKHFFRGFGDMPQRRETTSLGSGVIIDAKRGYIVTNHHVVEGADEIAVTMHDGQQFEAELVGFDPEADIALLKTDIKDLHALPFADSDKLRVGDFVLAIGNPFGLNQTVTSGIISALGRTGLGIEDYENFIQIDASINPGNSGGALVNLNGELIGLNTAILSAGGNGNIGIGFAIPINMVRNIVDQLIEFGEVRRGMLGVVMQNLTPELSRAFGLGMHQGVVISQVIEDTAAEEAGLKAGDVVVSINGVEVKSASAMRNIVGLLRVGDKMDIVVIRDGKQLELEATIREAEQQKMTAGAINENLDGATIEEVDKNGKSYIVVTEVQEGSPAWRASLRKGDIILSVNRVPVASIEEFRSAIGERGGQILLNIQRGRSALFIVIK